MRESEPEAERAGLPARTSPSVLIVIGVAGSGKTTVSAMLSQRLGWTYEDGDWFHPASNVDKMAAGTPLTDADRWPWLEAIAGWIDETVKAGRHGVVACSALKRRYRAVLVGAHADAVRIVHLNGTRELIGLRLTLRHGHFMPPALLDSQFAALEPPGEDEHAITVSVEPHPQEVVATIVASLEADLGRPLTAGP